MAMNRARRTSNLNNILTYDTLGNTTLIANLTVEGLTGAGFVKADAAGLLSVDTAAYTVVTGATNYLTKITGASTLGQSLVYDNGTSVLVNSTVGVPGYGHAFQVVANPSGGLVVSTTDVASAIGIVNSASANKTWDISPYGNHLVINESGIATRMKFDAGGNITIGDIVNTGHKLEVVGSFRTTGTNTLSQLQGVGDRMVVANTNGVLTTQPIPTGSITGSGAAGQVNFWTGTNTVSGSNNLFWDNANTALAIGGTTIDSNIALQVNSAKGIRISGTGGGFGYTIVRGIETSGLSNTGSSTVISSTNTLAFYTNGSEAFRVASNRNISIGTISDLGTRLGVVGDTLLRGSGNTNSTLVLTAQNSDSANVLRVFNGGSIGIGNAADRPLILPFTTSAGSPTLTGTNLSFFSGTGTQAATQGIFAFENIAAAQTSGNNYFIRALGNYRPTSGTGTYAHIRIEGIINQTGGANGITRGIWIDPTLTAAADWRSIEWSNNTGWGLYGAGTANNLLNGRLYIPAGSYDLPSLSFVNDTNTGLFSPLADNIELKTGTNNAVVLENQGVNLKTYSEVLASGGTNYQNISVSIPGNVVAPDGTTTANIAIPDATLAQHRFYHTVTVSEPYTTSIYAKSAGYNFISIGFAGGVNGGGIIFDIINGTVLGTAAGFIGQIENVGNGWFRCSLIRTSTAAATALSRFIIVRNANSTADYSGDGISGVYLWGYQIEENTASTSYTKTGATSVARPQATTILGQNLYGNLITRRVTGPSLTDLSFATGFTDRMTIHATSGNVMINSSNDLGQRLQVIGDVFIRGTGNTNTTNALAVQNSDSVNIFRVRNDATLSIGSFSENPLIYSSDSTGGVSANGASLTFNVQNGTSGSGRYIFTGAAKSSTAVSGNQNLVVYIQSFAPTSGGVSYNLLDVQPTINQTGGANGITRGIYINPVLTAAADFRAIEVSSGVTVLAPSTTTSASLRLPNGVAPTTPTNGDVWSTTTDLLARIGGTTYSLINSGLSGSGAAGQVTYWDSASNITGSNNLFWDNTNGRLGIGTNTPASSLQITSAATFATGIQLNNAGSIGYIWGDGSSMNIRPGATYGIQISAGSAGLIQATATTGGFRIELQALLAQPIYTYFSDNDTGIGRAAADTLTFHAGGERARFSTVGNLSIGAITDNGQRLQVYGDTLLRGSGNTNTTTALTVQNSSSTNLFSVLNNGNVGIGNNAPTNTLTLGSASAASLQVSAATFYSTSNSGNAFSVVSASSVSAFDRPTYQGIRARGSLLSPAAVSSGDFILSFLAAAYDGSAIQYSGAISFDAAANATVGNAPININFLTGSTGAGRTTRMTVFSGGNVSIGTTSDLGVRLGVVGDTLLRGSGNSSATTALTVQNSDSTNLFRIGNSGITTLTPLGLTGSEATNAISITQTWNTTGNPALIYGNLTNTASGSSSSLLRYDVGGTQIFNISTSGLIKFGNVQAANAGLAPIDTTNGNISANGLGLAFYMSGGTQTGYDFYFRNYSGTRTATSGTNGSIRTTVQFNPTSGTGTYDVISIGNTINQTGGASGITRGLYVNPNLVAAADFRAIETTVGKVIFAGAGNVMIGSATDDTVNKIQVTGTIVAGSGTSTNGSVILRGSYTNGYLTTVGTDASSGGPMLSYGVESAQNSTAGAFVSSSGITIPRSAYVQNGGHVWHTAASSTTAIGTAITMTKHMELYNSGNLVLGGGADDAVNRLQVSGGTSIAGRVIISSTTEHQLEVANPSGGRLLVFVSATANSFSFRDSQGYGIHHSTGYSGFNARQSNIRLWTQAADTILLNLGGQDVNPTVARTRTIIEPVGSATTAFSPTSGTAVDYLFRAQAFIAFQPTSGNATYTQMQLSPTINQTGGANGVTRGFHVNPTLTAAADWRSIEWSNNTGWGLYGVGTAKNYLNGTTLIGTTTDDGINKLQVAGSISSAGIMRADASRTAAINDVSIALLGSNITTYAAGFSMSAGGYGLNAIYAQHEQRFGGNATFDGGNLTGGGLILNKLAPTAAGTVTMTQQNSGLRVRTMSNLHLMTQFSGNNNLTVTHMSGMHIYGHYRTSGTGTLTVSTAYYGVFLADPNEFGTGATVTGTNWGFYQQGAAPINAFEGSMLVGTTTTDVNNRLVVSGNTRVTGNMTSAQFRLSALNTAPATATSTGVTGEIVIDANHIYVCTATNTWKRVAIATF